MAKKPIEETSLQKKIEEYAEIRHQTNVRNVGNYDDKYYRETEQRIRYEFSKLYDFFRQTYHKQWDSLIGAYSMVNVSRDTHLECTNQTHRTNQYYPVVRSRIDYAIQALFRGNITNLVRSLNRRKSNGKDVKTIQKFLDSCYSSGKAL
jgi:hypothetical protein